MTTAKDLTGQRFGRLTVLRRETKAGSKRAHWLCSCDCGTVAVKNGKYLLCGDTTSCGCEQKTMRARGNAKYGSLLARQHRKEYCAWRAMKSRCHTPSSNSYAQYGARGIVVCDRWRHDFAAFLADMGPAAEGLSIDRIDSTGNYEPGNCRWATWDVQANNTRRNRLVMFNDERMTLQQAARLAGVNYNSLHYRFVRLGEPFATAIQHATRLPSTP